MGLFESAKKLLKRWKKEGKTGKSFSNFTPRAQQVLALARKEADRFNHNYLATEHLLLGLIKLGQGVAVNVLQGLGIDMETVRIEVEKNIGAGQIRKAPINLPYTPRVKKVLAFAREEATALHHTYVGTEHLLLGLLREGDGIAAQVLRNLDVDIEGARQHVLKELDPSFVPGGLTTRTEHALAHAREEAERLHHDFVGTEHILLGLIKLEIGHSPETLKNLGLSLDNTRVEVEKLVGIGTGKMKSNDIPYSPQTIRVLEMAKEEAKMHCHSFIGIDHLLLGVLRDTDGIPAQVFKNFKVDVEQLRITILKELDPNYVSNQDLQTFRIESINKFFEAKPQQEHQFTPRAEQTLALARREADRLYHNYLGTEHLLVGLIELGGGVAANILKSHGMNLENVRAELEKLGKGKPGEQLFGNIPYTGRMKKVFDLARREARAMNHTYIGTEHLLLGLLQEKEGPGTQIFKTFNVNMEEMRTAILKALDPHS